MTIVERLRAGVRGGGYLLVSLPMGMAAMMAIPMVAATALTTVMAGLGLVLLPLALYGVRTWGLLESRRAAHHLGWESPVRPLALSGGPIVRLRQIVTDRGTWRGIGWLFGQATVGTFLGLIGFLTVAGVPMLILDLAVPDGASDPTEPLLNLFMLVVVAGLLLWGAAPLARLQARAALLVLSPSDAELRARELAARVDTLTETRAGAVNAHDAELRRIERDLHDGTQARLVSIAMRLGLAERAIADNASDPDALAKLIRDARSGAEEAMLDLRDVIRTMYPPILADRGLDGALAALGARCAVPTQVQVDGVGTLPAPVEAAAYFVVAEALTNIAKHSAATRAEVRVSRDADQLLVEVTDDGIGGADPVRGTGLDGIQRRVAALDGGAKVTSPVGGPTHVLAELPCGS